MKSIQALFLIPIIALANANVALAAVAVKKAAPVATQESSGNAGVASLVPTVLSLVSNVQALSAMQRELTQDCIPTAQEITFVDNTIKEWAKTGAMSADDVEKALHRRPCVGTTYQAEARMKAGTDMDLCYDTFSSEADELMIWYGYPKVGKASYCADGTATCSAKNKKDVSDIYEIFNLVDFAKEDYTKQEMTMAGKLMDKIENCSNAKLSDKKKAMWGEFLTTTIGSVGQRTNTGAIMETVSGIANTKGGLGGLSSLGAIATQFLDK